MGRKLRKLVSMNILLLTLSCLLSLPPLVEGMIYQPQSSWSMWDTWVTYHDGAYYMYLLEPAELPEGQTRWAPWFPGGTGVALATSNDGVHWKEIGTVLRKADQARGLGGNAVWKSPYFEKDGKFYMNFSEWGYHAHGRMETL